MQRITIPAAIVTAILGAASPSHADCSWTIQGRVRVTENEFQTADVTRDLAGVEVKVSGATVGQIYDGWGSAYTDETGRFTLSRTKSCADRNIKIEARLDNSNFRVINGEGSDWYELYRTPSKVGPGTHDFGARTFTDGAGTGDLDTRNNYRRAVTWYLLDTLEEQLVAQDAWFAFAPKIHVKYPANVISGSSYANGIDWTAYIHKNSNSDQWSVPTVLHEVMHLWNYDHNHGTTNWLDAVWGDGTTHGFQENPNIAFHEGFAEFAARALLERIWNKPFPYPAANRTNLAADGLMTPDMVQRNDDGVTRTLRLMTSPNLYPAIASCPAEPQLDVYDVLKVFQSGPGYPTDWQVQNGSYGLLLFLIRANDLLPAMTDDVELLIEEQIDIDSSVIPADHC